MSSKTDDRDGVKGEPPEKPKVKGGNRRRYREPRRDNKNTATTRPVRLAFRGLTEDLKGHIYDVGKGSQADQFIATTKALARYYGRECTHPQVIRIVIERQKDVTIPIPTTRTYIDK